jgi:hypothetical protein
MLKFQCPKCNGTALELVKKDVYLTYKVLELNEQEDFVYNKPEIDGDEMLGFGTIVGTQCIKCQYRLIGVNFEPLIDQEDVRDWIEKNCPQE